MITDKNKWYGCLPEEDLEVERRQPVGRPGPTPRERRSEPLLFDDDDAEEARQPTPLWRKLVFASFAVVVLVIAGIAFVQLLNKKGGHQAITNPTPPQGLPPVEIQTDTAAEPPELTAQTPAPVTPEADLRKPKLVQPIQTPEEPAKPSEQKPAAKGNIYYLVVGSFADYPSALAQGRLLARQSHHVRIQAFGNNFRLLADSAPSVEDANDKVSIYAETYDLQAWVLKHDRP